jgi:hypothetical protein
MFGKALEVSGMSISACINEGIEIEMSQAAPVVVTCVMDGDTVTKIYADEGIEFIREGGFISIDYKAGADITRICDRRALEKKIKAQAEENDAMYVHTKGE